MKFFNFFKFGKNEKRSKYGSKFQSTSGFFGRLKSGADINEDTAMQHSTVFQCVNVISESIASLPLHLYEENSETEKQRATSHPLSKILKRKANTEMTAFSFWQTMIYHILIWGKGFAYIERNKLNMIIGLWPLLPNKTKIKRTEKGELYVETKNLNNETVLLKRSEVLYIPGISVDGIDGKSPIAFARESIGLAVAAEEFGARFFGQGTHLGGVLEHPNSLSDEAYERLKEGFSNMHEGLTQSHRVKILEEGMKYHALGIPPEDAQFLETRKYQKEDIAALFRVPLHMVNSPSQSASNNIEQQDIGFVKHTLRPWIVRIEQAVYMDLLTEQEQEKYYAEFLVEGLLRGDIKSRYDAYSIGRQWGWLSVNDIRQKENMNAVKGGDTYMIPLNMIPAEMVEDYYTFLKSKNENQTNTS